MESTEEEEKEENQAGSWAEGLAKGRTFVFFPVDQVKIDPDTILNFTCYERFSSKEKTSLALKSLIRI